MNADAGSQTLSIGWRATSSAREHTARLIAVKLESMIEQSPRRCRGRRGIASPCALTAEAFAPTAHDAFAITQALAFDRDNPSSLLSSLRMRARQCAPGARAAFHRGVGAPEQALSAAPAGDDRMRSGCISPPRVFRESLEDLHTLGGRHLFDPAPRRRLALSRARPLHRARAARQPPARHPFRRRRAGLCRPPPPPKYFDWLVLLKFCTAFEPYCKEYTAAIRPEQIARVPAVRRGVSAFGALRGRPGRRCAGPRRARRAAGAPRRVRTSGRTAQGRGRFRPDRRTDRRLDRRVPGRTSPSNASRSTTRSMRRISPMARRRCCEKASGEW